MEKKIDKTAKDKKLEKAKSYNIRNEETDTTMEAGELEKL